MTATLLPRLTHRDHAVLRAVAAGRCALDDERGDSLTVDGFHCADQFAGSRLLRAGLIATAGSTPGPARLTAAGRALLTAAGRALPSAAGQSLPTAA